MWDWIILVIPYFVLLWVMVENKRKHAKATVQVWKNLPGRAKAYFVLLWGMVKNKRKYAKAIVQIWENSHTFVKNTIIVILILSVSVIIALTYNYYFPVENSTPQKTQITPGFGSIAVSISNEIALFFASFIAQMTIWARVMTNRQANYTSKQIELTRQANSNQIFYNRKQIELTRKANNNETFFKAVEMLHDSEKEIIILGGLQTIIDLAKDEPEFEYIRGKDFICNWLRQNYPEDKDTAIPPAIASLIKDFLGTQFKESERYVSAHMRKQGNNSGWPNIGGINLSRLDFDNIFLQDVSLAKANLQGARLPSANLQKANLRNANLQGAWLMHANLQGAWLFDANLQKAWLVGANLQEALLGGANLQSSNLDSANFKDADITLANMKDAEGLTKKQILSAKWFHNDRNDKPPELPDELLEDSDIQTWLKKSHDGYLL